ncbi:hypothetical protein A3715_17140 [Oleiphilus sp. HI0009]|jgi:hypothetical protein|uniref:phage integrase N-terminal SAM-like domain-containing protein n=1 Tax=unclassified Oleiphilus TaxID=2631174 RepID=UPI0007C35D74|nr:MULTISPECIES: phage integrase N-terminal SAM-like domain-containing protein [unclassified Oleiphilus]KZX76824.1 hypothetical protein A3715_12360 [Oleiphilus sp. HI0009]MCH2160016.1 phage integrase N-terminal SAM-like domain-containing protein [Oleiphilaceae bacterium]KZX85502.1 hypothetical protein A3715_17140 [Oleiphilus sp. HI0009]KZY64879.1 hypothetical protein A3738_09830 [Oleiphilus sp. HI0066]KZY71154.1 hypothetical protein A3739_17275 [Oleiphilus sp. HI0067]
MDAKIVLDEAQPGLADRMTKVCQKNALCERTFHTYEQWIAQYLTFNGLSNPFSLNEKNVKEFLRHVTRRLSPSRARLNQARQALEFFYSQVLKRPLEESAYALPSSK